MKIEVNIEKKYAFLILGIILALGIGGYVYAYNSNMGPSIMGHSAGELEVTLANGTVVSLQNAITNNFIGGGQPKCSSNQVLTYNSSGWGCVSSVGLGYKLMSAGYWCDTNIGNTGVMHIFPDNDSKQDCVAGWSTNPEDSVTSFLYDSTPVRRIILTAIQYESTGNWPAVGTKYIFNGGNTGNSNGCSNPAVACTIDNLPFNQPVQVYYANNRNITITLNVNNASSPGSVHTTPESLRMQLTGGDGVRFNITYEVFCPAYDGVCLDAIN